MVSGYLGSGAAAALHEPLPTPRQVSTRQTTSDDRGEFAASAIPAGAYTIRVELDLQDYTLSGLQLAAGQTVRQNLALEIGQVSQNIAVTESAPLVSTETSSQSENITATGDGTAHCARRDA